MAQAKHEAALEIGGREVVVTSPDKLLIPAAGVTKLDLVNYYLAVAEGALRGAGGRPCVLVRYPNGIEEEFFFQKRAPVMRPDWLEVAEIRFPSGRSAEEVVPRHPADLAWSRCCNSPKRTARATRPGRRTTAKLPASRSGRRPRSR